MNINLQINGKEVTVKEGKTIMEVAAKLGIYIPHFCYHPKLSIAANCRMCLVDVEKSPKPLPACATAALDGMVVRVDSPKAKEAQNSVMEFLLINHPLDCPICDQGGECQLQDLAVGYGMSKSRYAEEKRVVVEKNLGSLIATDMTRCIHCTRCVRFGREIGGIMELGMAGRGEHAEIMPFIERTVNSELSGNMIDVCPVGALTSKPFRFTARPWELSQKLGIATHDAWGSNLVLHVKDNVIKRVTPHDNHAINQCWISDRDRFSYTGLQAPDRAQSPLFRSPDARQFNKVPWQESIRFVVRAVKSAIAAHGANKIGFLASPSATNEELFLLQKIARGLGCDNLDSRLRQRDFSSVVPTEYGFRIAEMAKAGALLLVGASPPDEAPLLAARLRGQRRQPTMSIGPRALSERMPIVAEAVMRPSQLAENLHHINCFLGLSHHSSESLFDKTKLPAALENIAHRLKQTQGAKHIILGAAVCESPYLDAILKQVNILSTDLDIKVGALCGGANAAGANRFGFFPQQDGMHTQAMLDESLEAAVLFNCEPADFAEQSRAESFLLRTKFVCGIVSHVGGLERFADVLLPTAAFGENEGTITNGEGVSQQFTAAVPPPGEARPGWKILRVLGEALGIDGFDFESLDEVRAMMADFAPSANANPPPDSQTNVDSGNKASSPQNHRAQTNTNSPADLEKEDGEKWELAGGCAPYHADMVVRRSEVLQKTAIGKKASTAFLNPQDMAALSLDNGAAVRLSDGENEWDSRVFADKNIAPGVVDAHPPNLRTNGITLRALAETEHAESALPAKHSMAKAVAA